VSLSPGSLPFGDAPERRTYRLFKRGEKELLLSAEGTVKTQQTIFFDEKRQSFVDNKGHSGSGFGNKPAVSTLW
jgi:hypothetical protein